MTSRPSPRFERPNSIFFSAIQSSMRVEHDGSVTNWVEPRPFVTDPLGHLRLGALTFSADGAGGLAGGLAAPDDTWVVTTDLEVRLVAPVRDRTVRIVGTERRTGSTTAVCDLDLYDDATDEVLGAGSITSHCLTVEARPDATLWPRGQILNPFSERPEMPAPLGEYLGLTPGDGGAVELVMSDDVRNPWGMLHGGIVALAAEETVLHHPELAGRAPTGMLIRYLAPNRSGPIRFTPSIIGVSADQALVRVTSHDLGAGGRLTSSTMITLGPRIG